MPGPDDPIEKALRSLETCNRLLQITSSDLASPNREIRQRAATDMRHLSELGRAITEGRSKEIESDADVSIAALAASLDELHTIAADRRDYVRQATASKLLSALDRLALNISKVGRSGHRVA
jgi:hypothetical protein